MTSKTALLVIDVQNVMFEEGFSVYDSKGFLERLKKLVNQAREANIPVIYIQHQTPAGKPLEFGTKGWEIHEEIKPVDGERVIHKTTPDSFHETNLDNVLKENAIEHVILTGIQSEVCVDTTCRRAFSSGYQVTLVSDGHTTFDSGELTAQQIIAHENRTLIWFADVLPGIELFEKAVQ